MILYLDASALVKLAIPEDGTVDVERLWRSTIPIATSGVAQVEVACAVAAAHRGGRAGSDTPPSLADGSFIAHGAEVIPPDDGIVRDAARLGARHRLKALDAIHLASALRLRGVNPVFVSWDSRQRDGAAAEGLAIFPA